MSRNPGCTACLYCLLFDGLTFRDCLRSRCERSRPLSAFLRFPTGCMRGRCTGRIAWLHCIQVTLSVARSTAIVVAVSVAGRFRCRELASALHKTVSATFQGSLSFWRGFVILIDIVGACAARRYSLMLHKSRIQQPTYCSQQSVYLFAT